MPALDRGCDVDQTRSMRKGDTSTAIYCRCSARTRFADNDGALAAADERASPAVRVTGAIGRNDG